MNEKNKKMIAKEFLEIHFSLLSEHELIMQINAGSPSAEAQLLMLYMPRLLETAEELAKHFNDPREAMQAVMNGFLKGLRALAYRYYRKTNEGQEYIADWNAHLMDVYLKRIKEQILFYIRPNDETCYLQTYNKTQISRLNKLNELLKIRQETIVEKVLEHHAELELDREGGQSSLNDCTIKISMGYYVLESSYSIHSQVFSSAELGIKGFNNRFKNADFDWWADGMPVLDDSYCYLLSELFEQWLITHRIPDIALISMSIQIDNQNSILYKKGKWVFV